MGSRGTDVAREAAALILVQDDFASLVASVRLGRRIYSNIRHAMSFIVAVHVPIAGLGLLPVLLGWPLLFFPLHVLFLEFVIDPACAFVFEADREAADTMSRPPRPPGQALFSSAMLIRNVALGLVVLLASTAIYAAGLRLATEDEARALAFISIIAANLTLIFVSRSRSERLSRLLVKPNPIYWWIVLGTSAALAATVCVPAVAEVFRFAPPALGAATAVVAMAVSLVLAGGLLLRMR
jgi:Ca2+-transporting ATPase